MGTPEQDLDRYLRYQESKEKKQDAIFAIAQEIAGDEFQVIFDRVMEMSEAFTDENTAHFILGIMAKMCDGIEKIAEIELKRRSEQ